MCAVECVKLWDEMGKGNDVGDYALSIEDTKEFSSWKWVAALTKM